MDPKQTALEQYTKQKSLYGQNNPQILQKFLQYSTQCNDPSNIYRYMQQKSICIYLANYWTSRALLFAQMGDFRDALLCLKEAQQRDHIVSQEEVKIGEVLGRVRGRMVGAMRRVPSRSKRSVNQYSLVYQKESTPTLQNLQALVQIFQKNYKEAKKEIQKQFQLKMHGKKKSWMSSIYEQNQQKIRKISQKMKSVHNLESYLSMRTPISKKDPMRLTKTMDSVEMLKKKKSTQPKQHKKNKFSENNDINQAENQNKKCQSDSEDEQNAGHEQPICVHTTPIGRELSMLSRRVTFNTKYDKIQKIRRQEDSNTMNNLDSNSNSLERQNKIQKQAQMDRSKSISKRGSILKNKKTHQEHLKMEQQ